MHGSSEGAAGAGGGLVEDRGHRDSTQDVERSPLPEDAQTGDYLLFGGMGAYSIAMSTAFNGYGLAGVTLVSDLEGAPKRKAA